MEGESLTLRAQFLKNICEQLLLTDRTSVNSYFWLTEKGKREKSHKRENWKALISISHISIFCTLKFLFIQLCSWDFQTSISWWFKICFPFLYLKKNTLTSCIPCFYSPSLCIGRKRLLAKAKVKCWPQGVRVRSHALNDEACS